MSEPLFSVGEPVIVAPTETTISSGAYSGPAVVAEVVRDESWVGNCCNSPYVYRIDADPNGGYCECIIRKRPPPEEEFDSFIKKLDLDSDLADQLTPEVEEVLA